MAGAIEATEQGDFDAILYALTIVLTDFGGEELCPNGVMLLEFYTRSNRPLASGPIALFGNYENMWDLLRRRMESFLDCCRSGEYVCVVRWDSRSGGPILSLMSDREEIVWMFSRPETPDGDETEEDEHNDDDEESMG